MKARTPWLWALVFTAPFVLAERTAPALEGGMVPPGLQFDASDVLPVDEAFHFGHVPSGDGYTLFWQVMPGHYLYRHRMEARTATGSLPLELPTGTMRDDEIFGRVEVLGGYIETWVPGSAVEVSYQGCAEQGYCYPQQKRSLAPSR